MVEGDLDRENKVGKFGLTNERCGDLGAQIRHSAERLSAFCFHFLCI